MLTTFHWNALGSTLGWWFCHNNTVSCNEKFWVEQVTVPHPPWGRTRGGEGQGGGGMKYTSIPPPLPLHNPGQISWAFSHRAGTAPIITLYIPGTPLKTTPLQKHACSIQSRMGCRLQDTGARGKHQTTQKNPWCTSRGCKCRSQGPGAHGYRRWKTADFSHSAGTAHGAPPNSGTG